MNAILEKIFKLRRNTALNIDCKNTNRYRIVIKEFDGSKTAYYFSTPIYNNNTGKTVDVYLFDNTNRSFMRKEQRKIFKSR